MKKTLLSLVAMAPLIFTGCAERPQLVQNVPPPILKEPYLTRNSYDLTKVPDPKKEKPCFESIKTWRAKRWDEWYYVLLNHRYKEENGGDYWQSPKVTIETGGGDCEDIALLSVFYNEKDFGSKVMVLYGKLKGEENKEKKGFSHMIHLLESEGKFGTRGGAESEEVIPEYDLDSALIKYQEQNPNFKIEYYRLFDVNDLSKEWRVTERNLKLDFVNILYKTNRVDFPKKETEKKEDNEK